MTGLAHSPQTMSSREIAEICGKRHDHVMRDIRDMLVQLHGEGGVPKFGDTYRNPQNGQTYPIFALPKRETMILVSGYRLDIRTRIIDRWQELEAQAVRDPMEVLNDPASMRGLLLTYSEKVLSLQSEVAELAPKAEALDRLALADGSLCITDAAKTLQCKPKALFSYLRSHEWIYRRPGTEAWCGYQAKLQFGFLEHKVTTLHRPDGSEKISHQVRVTPKGLARLAREFEARPEVAA